MSNVKALCFDTGGTILDWHTGMRTALAAVGARHGIERDWARLANEFRRRSLKMIVNRIPPQCAALWLAEYAKPVVGKHLAERATIHGLKCWPDFPDSLARLRGKFMCVSFTLLSFRIVMDTARQNGISWDAVISCEAIGKYKVLPEAYKTCARFLQLDARRRTSSWPARVRHGKRRRSGTTDMFWSPCGPRCPSRCRSWQPFRPRRARACRTGRPPPAGRAASPRRRAAVPPRGPAAAWRHEQRCH